MATVVGECPACGFPIKEGYPLTYCPKCGKDLPDGLAAKPVASHAPIPLHVIVTDIRMPFESMVTFMVKWSLASIPALIILLLFLVVVTAMLSAFGISLSRL